MNTPKDVSTALKIEFPINSPNLTVSQPWVRSTELCKSGDAIIIHHFEDSKVCVFYILLKEYFIF